MKHFFVILACILLMYNCENNKNKTPNLIDFIPSNASIVIKASNFESLRSGINNNSLIEALKEFATVKDLKNKLQNLKYLNPNNEVLIAFGKDTKDSLEFLVITKHSKNLFNLEAISNHSIETISDKNKLISKTTLANQTLYSYIKDSIYFASNQLDLITNLAKNPIDSALKKIYESADHSKSLSVLSISKHTDYSPSFFQSKQLNGLQFTNYLLMDLDLEQNQITGNGITKAIDSSKSLINVFKNTIPQENQISKISPPETDGILSITFDNFKIFQENLLKLTPSNSLDIETYIFDNVIEIGELSKNNAHAVFLNSIDATSTKNELNYQSIIETYRDVMIYDFETPQLFYNALSPFISLKSASKFIVLDHYFVFSDDIEFLKYIILNFQNNTVLYDQSYYKDLMLNLIDESSLFIYNNASKLNTLLNVNFKEEKNLSLNNYKASAIQFIYDTDFAHVNAITKTSKAKTTVNSVSEELTITLDHDLLITPQLVVNHTNKEKDIAVQDVKNNLYLISNGGKIFWKKQLDGKILGKIEQIDIYKNGRLQLVFSTSKRLYILDRTGKDVTNFPLKFNDLITQPVSVFDYDNKKDYRLLITQGAHLLMYNTSGKIVKGFTYKKAPNAIISQPKHFKIGRKDYIVFAEGKTIEIIDRVGKPRITTKGDINFSNNEIYLYLNKFTTTDKNGNLIMVDTKGAQSNTRLELKEKHTITTTSKTFVSLSENKLKIRSKTIELDFGDYTAPKIFYLNDKIYVTTTDLQAKRAYLFDSQSQPIPNFPVYGNSSIELDNIDKDQNLEVVTKGDSNSLIIYQIN